MGGITVENYLEMIKGLKWLYTVSIVYDTHTYEHNLKSYFQIYNKKYHLCGAKSNFKSCQIKNGSNSNLNT